MPEGPEVTIIKEGLNKILKNKLIITIEILEGSRYKKKLPDNYGHFIDNIPLKINSIENKGKLIYFNFDKNITMINTLGMSGIWSHKREKHASIKLFYKSQNFIKHLYFIDQRHFGTIKFLKTKMELNDKLKTIGPDILNDDKMNLDLFKNILTKHKNKNITSVLMNQKIISGIGNYLKSESLYLAKISPFRIINTLTEEELYRLYQSCRVKIVGSYNSGGVSLKHYKDIDDRQGQFTFKLEVYGKKKDKLGNTIKHDMTPDKRFTYWVPSIQS